MRTKNAYLQSLLFFATIFLLLSTIVNSKNIEGLLVDCHWIATITDQGEFNKIELMHREEDGTLTSFPCRVNKVTEHPSVTSGSNHRIRLLHLSSPLLEAPIIRSIQPFEIICKPSKIVKIIPPLIHNQETILSQDIIQFINSTIIRDACSPSLTTKQKKANLEHAKLVLLGQHVQATEIVGETPSPTSSSAPGLIENKNSSHRRSLSDSGSSVTLNRSRHGILERSNSDPSIIDSDSSIEDIEEDLILPEEFESISSLTEEFTYLLTNYEIMKRVIYSNQCNLINILYKLGIEKKQCIPDGISTQLKNYYKTLGKYFNGEAKHKARANVVREAKRQAKHKGITSYIPNALKVLTHLENPGDRPYGLTAVNYFINTCGLNAIPAFRMAIYYQHRAFVHPEETTPSISLVPFFKNLIGHTDFIALNECRQAVVQELKDIQCTQEKGENSDLEKNKEFFQTFRKTLEKHYQGDDKKNLLLHLDPDNTTDSSKTTEGLRKRKGSLFQFSQKLRK